MWASYLLDSLWYDNGTQKTCDFTKNFSFVRKLSSKFATRRVHFRFVLWLMLLLLLCDTANLVLVIDFHHSTHKKNYGEKLYSIILDVCSILTAFTLMALSRIINTPSKIHHLLLIPYRLNENCSVLKICYTQSISHKAFMKFRPNMRYRDQHIGYIEWIEKKKQWKRSFSMSNYR